MAKSVVHRGPLPPRGRYQRSSDRFCRGPCSQTIFAPPRRCRRSNGAGPTASTAGLIENELGTGGDDPSGDSSSSLSTGAIAGIAVGSILGVIALIAAIFFILRRRRRTNRAELAGSGVAEADNNAHIQEMSGENSGAHQHLMGKWRAEAQGDQPQVPVEIDSRGVKVVTKAPVEME